MKNLGQVTDDQDIARKQDVAAAVYNINVNFGSLPAKVATAQSDIVNLDGRVDTLETSTSDITSTLNTHGNKLYNINWVFSAPSTGSGNGYTYTYMYINNLNTSGKKILLWGHTTTKGNVTITLPQSMKNDDYTIVVSDERTSSNTTYSACQSVTTTNFMVVANNSNYSRFIVIGDIS